MDDDLIYRFNLRIRDKVTDNDDNDDFDEDDEDDDDSDDHDDERSIIYFNN